MVRVQYPASITDFETRFWRYTLRDLARIGVPAFLGWSLTGVLGLLMGGLIGVAAAELTVHEKHVDEHVAEFVRFQLGTSQSSWPEIEEVHDGAAVLTDGTVLGLVRVSSVDVGLASDAEQRANRDTVYDLVKGIEYPVEIHSRQRRIDLSQYQGADDQAVVTDHFAVIRLHSEADTGFPFFSSTGGGGGQDEDAEDGAGSGGSEAVDNAVEEVVDRCIEVRQALTAGDLYAERVTGDDLRETVQRLNLDGVSLSRRQYTVEASETPHHQLLYITEYPQQVRIAWIADLLNSDTPGLVDAVQVIDPISQDQRDLLDRMMGRLRSELARVQSPTREAELQRKKQDAEQLTAAEAGGEERLTNYGVYIIARAQTREELDATVDTVTSILRRYRIKYGEPVLQTHRAVKTESLVHHDALGKTLIVPGRSAASGFSFSTQDVIASTGAVIGYDTRNGMPVILDRFQWDAPHIAKMGKSGSGKTYHTSLELLRAYQEYDDLRIRIIDPKPDYGAVINALNGDTIILDQTDLDDIDVENDVARFVVTDPSRDTTDLLTEAVRYIHREGYGDTRKTLVVIDEAHRLLDRGGADAVAAVETLIREGREWNLGVTLATQSAEDFTATRSGRNILRNVDCTVFFKHEQLSDEVPEFFRLSPREATALTKLRTGSDLPFSEAVIRGPVTTRLRITATEQEHAVITSESAEDTELKAMSNHSRDNNESRDTEQTTEKAADSTEASKTDGGTTTRRTPDPADASTPSTATERRRSTTGSPSTRRREPDTSFMELPDTRVTENEDPDVDASAEELLPEVLPGWERQTTDMDRWKVPVAEDWITATYRDLWGDRYMVHVSRWDSGHVQYALDELYGSGKPTRFDAWTARGRFIFAVKISSGTVQQARTLLAASPALSHGYLNNPR